MEFKHRLKRLRTERGYTQDALAKKIFVSRSAIAKWEAGLGVPNDESLSAICNVLEITKDDLFPNKEVEALLVEKNINIKRKRITLIALSICLAVSLALLSILFIVGINKAKLISELTPSIDKVYFEKTHASDTSVAMYENKYRLYTNTHTQAYISMSVDARLDVKNLQITFDKADVSSCILVDEKTNNTIKNYHYRVTFEMLDVDANELKITSATYKYFDILDKSSYKIKECFINAKPLPIAVSDKRTATVTLKFNLDEIVSFEVNKGESVESGIFAVGEQEFLIDNLIKNNYPQLSGIVTFEGWERADGVPLHKALYSDVILNACVRVNPSADISVEAQDISCNLFNNVIPNFILNGKSYNNVIYTLSTDSDCIEINEKREIKGVKPGTATVFVDYNLGFYSGQSSFSVTISDKAFIRVLGYKKELPPGGVFVMTIEGNYNYQTNKVVLSEEKKQELLEYFDKQNADFFNATGYKRKLVELKYINDVVIVPIFETDYIFNFNEMQLEFCIGKHIVKAGEEITAITIERKNIKLNHISYKSLDELYDTDYLTYFEVDGEVIGTELPENIDKVTFCISLCVEWNNTSYYNTYKIPIIII